MNLSFNHLVGCFNFEIRNKNYAIAESYARIGAERGCAPLQLSLGKLKISTGKPEIETDEYEAYKWFKAAFQNGNESIKSAAKLEIDRFEKVHQQNVINNKVSLNKYLDALIQDCDEIRKDVFSGTVFSKMSRAGGRACKNEFDQFLESEINNYFNQHINYFSSLKVDVNKVGIKFSTAKQLLYHYSFFDSVKNILDNFKLKNMGEKWLEVNYNTFKLYANIKYHAGDVRGILNNNEKKDIENYVAILTSRIQEMHLPNVEDRTAKELWEDFFYSDSFEEIQRKLIKTEEALNKKIDELEGDLFVLSQEIEELESRIVPNEEGVEDVLAEATAHNPNQEIHQLLVDDLQNEVTLKKLMDRMDFELLFQSGKYCLYSVEGGLILFTGDGKRRKSGVVRAVATALREGRVRELCRNKTDEWDLLKRNHIAEIQKVKANLFEAVEKGQPYNLQKEFQKYQPCEIRKKDPNRGITLLENKIAQLERGLNHLLDKVEELQNQVVLEQVEEDTWTSRFETNRKSAIDLAKSKKVKNLLSGSFQTVADLVELLRSVEGMSYEEINGHIHFRGLAKDGPRRIFIKKFTKNLPARIGVKKVVMEAVVAVLENS